MRRNAKKFEQHSVNYPAKTEVRELVHIPRRSPDVATSYAYEPTHAHDMPRGSLYVVGHIEDATEDERPILNAIALEARKAYYHANRGTPENCFRAALRHINQYLAERAPDISAASSYSRFHVSIMSVSGSSLMLGEAGSVFSFVLRDGKLVAISRKSRTPQTASEEKPFGYFIKGDLKARDFVLTITPHFLDTGLISKIGDEFLAPHMLDEVERHCSEHGEHAEFIKNRAAAAIILRYGGNGAEARAEEFAVGSVSSRWSESAQVRESSTQSRMSKILESMISGSENSSDAPHYEDSIRSENDNSSIAASVKSFARRWKYIWILCAAAFVASGLYIKSVNSEIASRATFEAQISSNLDGFRSDAASDAADANFRRRMRYEKLAASLAQTGFTGSVDTEAKHLRGTLQNAIGEMSREDEPQNFSVLADFSKLTVEFEPQVLIMSRDEYIIAENSTLQFMRVSQNDFKPRLVITGLGHQDVIASASTKEASARIVWLGTDAIGLYDPEMRKFSGGSGAFGRYASEGAIIAAGAKEIYLVSPSGPIAKKMIAAKSASFTAVKLPKTYAATKWVAADTMGSSLYLVSEAGKLVRITAGAIESSADLKLAILPDSQTSLVGLPQKKILALLDGGNSRIVFIDSSGKVTAQYHNALFSGLRDIAETPDGGFVVLTDTRLISFGGSMKPSPSPSIGCPAPATP
jgi:hypothetical protein